MRPVVIAGVERLFDQQAAETGAIDVQVRADHAAIFEHQPRHVAYIILRDADDLALDAVDAARLAVAAQMARIETRVEVKGIRHVRQYARGTRRTALHPLRQRRLVVQRIGREIARQPQFSRAQPIMMERQQPDIAADVAKGVHVALAGCTPIDKFDAEFVRPLCRAQKRVLVQPERVVEQPDLGDRRLAHADRADLLGFDQVDFEADLQKARERGRRHPTGGAAAGNDDPDRSGAIRLRRIGHGPRPRLLNFRYRKGER